MSQRRCSRTRHHRASSSGSDPSPCVGGAGGGAGHPSLVTGSCCNKVAVRCHPRSPGRAQQLLCARGRHRCAGAGRAAGEPRHDPPGRGGPTAAGPPQAEEGMGTGTRDRHHTPGARSQGAPWHVAARGGVLGLSGSFPNSSLSSRNLGKSGLRVSCLGLGKCRGLPRLLHPAAAAGAPRRWRCFAKGKKGFPSGPVAFLRRGPEVVKLFSLFPLQRNRKRPGCAGSTGPTAAATCRGCAGGAGVGGRGLGAAHQGLGAHCAHTLSPPQEHG